MIYVEKLFTHAAILKRMLHHSRLYIRDSCPGRHAPTIEHNPTCLCSRPVASFKTEVKPSLAKPPLNLNSGLDKHGLTSFVKSATIVRAWLQARHFSWFVYYIVHCHYHPSTNGSHLVHWNEKLVMLTRFGVVTQVQPVTTWVVTCKCGHRDCLVSRHDYLW